MVLNAGWTQSAPETFFVFAAKPQIGSRYSKFIRGEFLQL